MAAQVYVGIITRDYVYWETVNGLIGAATSDSAVGRIKIRPCGPYLDDGRNLSIDDYLNDPSTETLPWFLFLDSDVCSPEHDDPFHLAALVHELVNPGGIPLHGDRFPVICGLYRNPTPSGVDKPVTYAWEMKDRGDGVEVMGFRQHTSKELAKLPPYQHPQDAAPIHPDITDVGAAGTGFMAIHRSLLLRMRAEIGYPQPWFHEPVINGIHMGEDMGFCARIGEMGVPVLVHRGVLLDHYKSTIVHAT